MITKIGNEEAKRRGYTIGGGIAGGVIGGCGAGLIGATYGTNADNIKFNIKRNYNDKIQKAQNNIFNRYMNEVANATRASKEALYGTLDIKDDGVRKIMKNIADNKLQECKLMVDSQAKLKEESLKNMEKYYADKCEKDIAKQIKRLKLRNAISAGLLGLGGIAGGAYLANRIAQ